MSHGTPEITKEINEAMRGLVGGTASYARIMGRIQHYMPTKLTEMAAAHGSDRHDHTFGLSGAGGCVRKAQLAAMGESITFSPGKLFTFAIGHLLEPFALALLEECGWTIVEPQAEVVIPGEHGLPLFHSWTDGIIERGGKRYALSTKTMGYKNSALFRGKATRRGFTALPFEGASEMWRAQSQLEMYGLKLDQALIVVLSKEYMEVFETEDPYMKESGSAVVWTDVMEAQTKWVESFILPTWREAQRAVLAGELSDGKILHKESGMYKPTDPRKDNKKTNGWDWDRCRWSTGACDMRDACMAAHKAAEA